MGEGSENNQSASKEVSLGIKKFKDWFQSKHFKDYLKEQKTDIALTAGIVFSIGAGAIATLIIGGPALALSIASWGSTELVKNAFFNEIWDEIKKNLKRATCKKDITDKEAAEYILKLKPDELSTLTVAVFTKFKDDSEIKLFLTNIMKRTVESKDVKELLGQTLVAEIKKDIDAQNKEILEEVRKCGIRSFCEIMMESEKIDFNEVFNAFRRTIRISPEEMICVIENNGTIERTLENEAIRDINNGKNVFILGMIGSGKTVFLMRLCYKLYLQGWKIFFSNERIEGQKSRELFLRTDGKKLLVIDNAAKYDEYFDLIENLRGDIRIVMAEQEIIWVNKNRCVKGYNFNELKLELSEKEGIDYLDKFGGNKRLLKVCKNIFPILTYLVTNEKENLDKLVDAIWCGLSTEEKNKAYPIFVLSSLNIDYPRKLFFENYDSPHIIETLRKKNIIDVKGSTISTIHPFLSQKIIENTMVDMHEEYDKVIKKLLSKEK